MIQMPGWLWLRGRLNRLRVTVAAQHCTVHAPPPWHRVTIETSSVNTDRRVETPHPTATSRWKDPFFFKRWPPGYQRNVWEFCISEKERKKFEKFPKIKGTVSRGFNFKERVCCLYVLNIKYFIFLERKKEPQKWWLVRLCVQNKPNKKSKLSLG